jgi:predicted small lipoprotein YifL
MEAPVRPILSCICIIAAALAGCSAKPPLTLQDKAMVTSELIDPRPDCAVYSKQLAVPGVDEKSILQTYQAARAAFCLKPHV